LLYFLQVFSPAGRKTLLAKMSFRVEASVELRAAASFRVLDGGHETASKRQTKIPVTALNASQIARKLRAGRRA
jgi:hypothetical protein